MTWRASRVSARAFLRLRSGPVVRFDSTRGLVLHLLSGSRPRGDAKLPMALDAIDLLCNAIGRDSVGRAKMEYEIVQPPIQRSQLTDRVH